MKLISHFSATFDRQMAVATTRPTYSIGLGPQNPAKKLTRWEKTF